MDHSAVKIEMDDDLGEVFLIARTPDGRFLERVAGEEQHHSSWLFGDPVTPILRCYKGDPARIRLVHGGVKETHVFHLHVHQWRATPQDTAKPGTAAGSQLLDSITIGPQTAYTIDPLYGSGSRQQAPGDVIWHCHLYPHFHHGMWGLWRSFDRLVDGTLAFPDGTPGRPLEPLPGRKPKPPTPEQPGFPWFIDARYPQKSPPPPALLPEHKYGRPARCSACRCTRPLEKAAFAQGVVDRPRPGVLFVDLDGDAGRLERGRGPAAAPDPALRRRGRLEPGRVQRQRLARRQRPLLPDHRHHDHASSTPRARRDVRDARRPRRPPRRRSSRAPTTATSSS